MRNLNFLKKCVSGCQGAAIIERKMSPSDSRNLYVNKDLLSKNGIQKTRPWLNNIIQSKIRLARMDLVTGLVAPLLGNAQQPNLHFS